MEIVKLTGPVLPSVSQPLPTALGTLDALHLATALLWREQTSADLVMATHGEALATVPRSGCIARPYNTHVDDFSLAKEMVSDVFVGATRHRARHCVVASVLCLGDIASRRGLVWARVHLYD